METWMVLPAAVLILGLAAFGIGAWRDRVRRQQALQMLNSAPDRTIHGFTPSVEPSYVLRDDVARERLLVEEPIADHAADQDGAALSVAATMASPEFATHVSGHALLNNPSVLVMSGVPSLISLLTILDRHARSEESLVLVAPSWQHPAAAEVLTTLEVNSIRHTLNVLAVAATDEVAAEIAEFSGGLVTDEFDIEAGYVPEEQFGTLARWLSEPEQATLTQAG